MAGHATGSGHDATTLGQRFVVLAVSGVYRGCAIPVAWVILPASAKHAWRREWLRLLRLLRPAIPRGWTVIVLADRGLYAPWLFRRITRRGWQPFLRLNTGGSFRPAGAAGWRPLAPFVPRPGPSWRGSGSAFTRHQVACTLLARWEEGDKDPWLIRTALPPEASDAGWYGLRAWIEQSFKITTRQHAAGRDRAVPGPPAVAPGDAPMAWDWFSAAYEAKYLQAPDGRAQDRAV